MQWTTGHYDFDAEKDIEYTVEVSDEQAKHLEQRTVSILCYPVGKPEESLTITYLEAHKPRFNYSGVDKGLLLRRLELVKKHIDLFISENNI